MNYNYLMHSTINIHQKAIENLRAYVLLLQTLITNNTYDCLLGAGNTGQLMVYIAEKVYNLLGHTVPPKVLLPILRYKGIDHPDNIFDNSVLYPDLLSQIEKRSIKTLSNILFVDDEIYAGLAVNACMQLILRYCQEHQLSPSVTCTIVAEDQGVEKNFSIPNVKTTLSLFIEGRDDMSNAITYCLPNTIIAPIKKQFENIISDHTFINVALHLPIRRKQDVKNIPKFTMKYSEIAENTIPDFYNLQKQAKEEMDLIIRNVIEKK